MATARSPGPDLLPVLLLAGLAVWLVTRQRPAMAAAATQQATANRDAARLAAIGQAASGFFGWLTGGSNGNHSNATPTPAALDQIVDAANVWTATYGEAAGVDGDPYNDTL